MRRPRMTARSYHIHFRGLQKYEIFISAHRELMRFTTNLILPSCTQPARVRAKNSAQKSVQYEDVIVVRVRS